MFSTRLLILLLSSLIGFATVAEETSKSTEPPPMLDKKGPPAASDPATVPDSKAPRKKAILEDASTAVENAAGKATKFLGESRERRAKENVVALINYSPMDLILPGKYGGTLGYISNADTTWEFEYLHASVAVPLLISDLGSMSDDRFSLIRRSFFGSNSFNFSYGLTYFDFSIHLGDKLLNRLSGANYPNVDLVSLQSLGFNLGIGNRWTFGHNITFGVDWISWSQPVVILKKDAEFLKHVSNEKDRDDVDTAVDIISYFPRLAFLKLQLGILF